MAPDAKPESPGTLASSNSTLPANNTAHDGTRRRDAEKEDRAGEVEEESPGHTPSDESAEYAPIKTNTQTGKPKLERRKTIQSEDDLFRVLSQRRARAP